MGVGTGVFLCLSSSASSPATQNIVTKKIVTNSSLAVQNIVTKSTVSQPNKNSDAIRLIIPTIKVDAAVEPVGLTADQSVATLSSSFDVGWYKFGPHPGQKGSAIIEGHVDTLDGKAGVFYSLNNLKIGDKVYFQNGKDTTTFVVWQKKDFAFDAQPPEVFNSNDRAYLNLITCNGSWDKSHNRFDERLVVFTAADF